MGTLEDHDYRVYSSEINLIALEKTCVEYGLKRMTPCPANSDARVRVAAAARDRDA